MKKILVLILAIGFAAPVAHADEASKRAKAEKIVSLMHMDKTMVQMVEMIKSQMQTGMNQSFDKQTLTKKQQAVMDDFENHAMALVVSYLSWDAMKPDVIKVYAENLTEEEMDGMIAFYSSPIGQSVLAKMPTLMQSSMTLTQARMGDLQPKIKAMIVDYTEKMKAASN